MLERYIRNDSDSRDKPVSLRFWTSTNQRRGSSVSISDLSVTSYRVLHTLPPSDFKFRVEIVRGQQRNLLEGF